MAIDAQGGGPGRRLGSAWRAFTQTDAAWILRRVGLFFLIAAAVVPAIMVATGLLGALLTNWPERASNKVLFQGVLFGLVVALLVARYRRFLWDFLGFCIMRPIQSVVLLVVFALIYGQIGNGLGMPTLFWSEDPVTRIAVALAATLVLALIGLNAYYLIAPEHYAGIIDKVERFLGDPGDDHTWRRTAARLPFIDFERWLDPPRREVPSNPYRLSRFLRLVRLPFLVLLALPALLPAFFVNVPKAAPIVLDIDRMTLWSDGFRPDVGSDVRAYVLGATLWLFGIWLGVQMIKAFIRISDWFAQGALGEAGVAGPAPAPTSPPAAAVRAGPPADGPPSPARPPEPRSLLIYSFFATIVYLTMALSPLYSGDWYFEKHDPRTVADDERTRLDFGLWFYKDGPPAYLIAGTVLLVVLPLLVALVLRFWTRRAAGGAAARRVEILANILFVVFAAELFLFGVLGIAFASINYKGIAPAVAILGLLGMVALASTLFGLGVRQPRPRLIGVVLILALIGLNNNALDGYRFEQLDYEYCEDGRPGYPVAGRTERARVDEADAPGPEAASYASLVPDRVALENWRDQFPQPCKGDIRYACPDP